MVTLVHSVKAESADSGLPAHNRISPSMLAMDVRQES